MADKKQSLIENPLAPEIYADKTSSVALRGNVARITFASERAASDPHTPNLVVSGHLAMSMRGFLQLFAQMQSVVRQMEAQGLLKGGDNTVQAPPPAPPPPPPPPPAAKKKPSATSKKRPKTTARGRGSRTKKS